MNVEPLFTVALLLVFIVALPWRLGRYAGAILASATRLSSRAGRQASAVFAGLDVKTSICFAAISRCFEVLNAAPWYAPHGFVGA